MTARYSIGVDWGTADGDYTTIAIIDHRTHAALYVGPEDALPRSWLWRLRLWWWRITRSVVVVYEQNSP